MNNFILLRVEAAAELGLVCWLYHHGASSWYLFAALFLVPDLGMIGYLAGPRVGAACYNLLHTYVLSIPLVMLATMLNHPLIFAIGLIWCGHIAADRMLGYGLKTIGSFHKTHLNIP